MIGKIESIVYFALMLPFFPKNWNYFASDYLSSRDAGVPVEVAKLNAARNYLLKH